MMHHRLRRRSGEASAEGEALQTDVMRFLVVICLCLMMVFSLVQALPVSDSNNMPRINNAELLQQDVKALENRIDALQLARQELENRLQEARNELQAGATALEQQQQALHSLNHEQRNRLEEIRKEEARLELVNNQVDKLKDKEARLLASVRAATSELAHKHADLAKVTTLVEQGRKQLNIVQADLREAQRRLEESSMSPQQAPPQHPAEEQQEGFTLAFASDEALLQLLQTNSGASLFMLSGKKSYKLEVRKSGELLFFPSRAPATLYEITHHTVPSRVRAAGRKTIAAFGAGSVTYGVYLPPMITRQFKAVMAGRDRGKLVISARGQVTLN